MDTLLKKNPFPHHHSETSTEYQTSTVRHSHSFVMEWTDKMTTQLHALYGSIIPACTNEFLCYYIFFQLKEENKFHNS